MTNENNVMEFELEIEDVKGEREYTKLYGGFGEGQPVITDLQIAELLKYSIGARQVRRLVDRNLEHFEEYHLIDFQRVPEIATLSNALQSLGYSKQSITQAKNIYGFSKAGFLLFLKFAEGDRAVELFKDFIEDYFKIKEKVKTLIETLQEQIDYLNEEKTMLLGRMFMEQNELKKMEYMNKIEGINVQLIKLQSELTSKKDNEEIDNALQTQSKITKSKQTYVNQGDFGAMFNLKIGSVMVGKLLKIVGIAQKQGKTRPYEKNVPKYAQAYVNQDIGIASYKWNYNECIAVIDKWLKEHGRYEEFYNCEHKDSRNGLINHLYDAYVDCY